MITPVTGQAQSAEGARYVIERIACAFLTSLLVRSPMWDKMPRLRSR